MATKKIVATKSAKPKSKTANYLGASSHSLDLPVAQKQKRLVELIHAYLEMHGPKPNSPMPLKEFAEVSGIGISNVVAIVNSIRWVPNCNRETIEALANILGIPVLQVFIFSGYFSAKDVFYADENIHETLDAIYRKMARDKTLKFKAPHQDDWDKWPLSAKVAVCMMYEELILQNLLRYASA
jgi:hypothetical protein